MTGLRLRLLVNLLAATIVVSPFLVMAVLWPARDEALLFLLAGVLSLFILALFLLERAIVRRLSPVATELSRLAAEADAVDKSLLVREGGDALGRLGLEVHLLGEAWRAERARTQARFEELTAVLTQLRAAQDELVRSERLATVGQLAAGVAHEVGNPLAAITGYAEILRKPAAAEAVLEYAQRIEREARRIDRIVRDLLNLARPSSGPLGKVDLTLVIAIARRLVEPQKAWGKMRLVIALPADLPSVRAEEHALIQVLVNLLMNAAAATRGAGEAQVRARVDGATVALEILDDGPGFSAETMRQLFSPFFTTKPAGEGTGLGLAICQRTLNGFGGSIAAANRLEGGAALTLKLNISV